MRYTKEHEWIKVEGEVGTVGITNYAVGQLGDITFLELPSVGQAVSKGASAAFIESVKAASDIYSPVSGEVVEVNGALSDAPQLVNEGPESVGWIFKVRLGNRAELDGMMDKVSYDSFLATF